MRLAILVLPLVFAFASLAVDPPTPVEKTKDARLARIKWLVKDESAAPLAKKKADAEAAKGVAAKTFSDIEKTYKPIKTAYDALVAKQAKEGTAFSGPDREKLVEYQLQLEDETGLQKKLEKAQTELTTASNAWTAAITAAGVDKGAEAKEVSVSAIETALSNLALKSDFDELKIEGLREENKLQALSAKLDGTILGAYMQDKMEGLLGTPEFCAAQTACTAGKPAAQPLKGLFDKKSHGKK